MASSEGDNSNEGKGMKIRNDDDYDISTSTSSDDTWMHQFPSLQSAFDRDRRDDMSLLDQKEQKISVRIMGILFAAAWCDDCQIFMPHLIHVLSFLEKKHKKGLDNALHMTNVVYVSSDVSAAEMHAFIQQPSSSFFRFRVVPFDDTEERSRLKQYFGTCAQRELPVLPVTTPTTTTTPAASPHHPPLLYNMTAKERRHGIPTLILVDARTGRVLTEHAADPIRKIAAIQAAQPVAEASSFATSATEVEAQAEAIVEEWKTMMLLMNATAADAE